jgi:hypothetical protein
MERGRPKKETTGIADAAEWLWAVYDGFKANNETAQDLMRDARVLLSVSVDRAMAALRSNHAEIERVTRQKMGVNRG